MECVDETYESFLRSVFPPDEYSVLHDTLLNFEWKTTRHHAESFRQHCVHTASHMQKLCEERRLLQGTWNGWTHAQLVGFLHDVGKPFVQKNTQKGYQCFGGHAQVGARLVYLRFRHEIPEDILFRMTTAIDAHMCSLRNADDVSREDVARINSIMHLYLPPPPPPQNSLQDQLIPILECLHRADAMGKIPRCDDERPAYSPEPIPFSYRKDDKIAIFMIGPSGSGKSALATLLKSRLSAHGSVDHLERDALLMEYAREGEGYEECRRRVYDDPALLKEFRDRWTSSLRSADARIVIVDTVQNYYRPELQFFAHRFRIGMYCVPMRLIDDVLCGKRANAPFPPREKWPGYQKVATECKDCDWGLEVGTGVWRAIPGLVKRYLDRCEATAAIPLERQPTLATLWNEGDGGGRDAIAARFDRKTLTFSNQYELGQGGGGEKIVRVSYLDGRDVVYAPTRYYRGEFLLETREGAFALRSGLPTFRKNLEVEDDFERIVATPKYDGILVNVLHVPKRHRHYETLERAFPETRYRNGAGGLLFVGSKQKLLMEESIRQCFDAVIGDVEPFVAHYDRHLRDDDTTTTLHFEMIPKESRDELTVYYPESTWVFLGYTRFDDTTRSFSLPEPTDFRAVERKELRSLAEFREYAEERHRDLLRGDESVQPEGFVLYAYKDGLKDMIKSKFPEYFAANYPKRNSEVFEALYANPLLRNRFQKYRNTREVIRGLLNPLTTELDAFLTEKLQLDRKSFALYSKEHDDEIRAFQQRLDDVATQTRVSRFNFLGIVFRNFPDKEAILKRILEAFRHLMEDDDETKS